MTSSCLNGATCINSLTGFSCLCATGYQGSTCQQNICATQSPCLNGGSCYGNGQCTCTARYNGPTCSIDQCIANPCQNGGTCNRDGTCICTNDFFGSRCEIASCGIIRYVRIHFVSLNYRNTLVKIKIYYKTEVGTRRFREALKKPMHNNANTTFIEICLIF